MEDKALARCNIVFTGRDPSVYRCDYGSVTAIQRLGWFSVNLSFKLSYVYDDINAYKKGSCCPQEAPLQKLEPSRIVRNTVGRQNLTRHGVTLISKKKKSSARQASEVPKQTKPVKQGKHDYN